MAQYPFSRRPPARIAPYVVCTRDRRFLFRSPAASISCAGRRIGPDFCRNGADPDESECSTNLRSASLQDESVTGSCRPAASPPVRRANLQGGRGPHLSVASGLGLLLPCCTRRVPCRLLPCHRRVPGAFSASAVTPDWVAIGLSLVAPCSFSSSSCWPTSHCPSAPRHSRRRPGSCRFGRSARRLGREGNSATSRPVCPVFEPVNCSFFARPVLGLL